MASNQRILKAYERYDGNRKVVPGSLVLRSKMPKNGRWKEVQEYLCCNGVELFFTPASYPIEVPSVELLCNGSYVAEEAVSGIANNINELVAILNSIPETANFGYYAPQSNGSVKLTVPDNIKEQYCPTGTLSFTITPD